MKWKKLYYKEENEHSALWEITAGHHRVIAWRDGNTWVCKGYIGEHWLPFAKCFGDLHITAKTRKDLMPMVKYFIEECDA